MNVSVLEMPKTEAAEKYQEYVEAIKGRKEKYLDELRRAYLALKRGQRLIDIFASFKKTDVNETGEPRLAIAPASAAQVYLRKQWGGGAIFSHLKNSWEHGNRVMEVNVPDQTFPDWPRIKDQQGNLTREIVREVVTTPVPTIPAHLLPPGDLDDYHILWEVKEWRLVAPPIRRVDPFLLQRINANVFIVLAEWDVTAVEQMIMRGRPFGGGRG